MVLTYWFQDGCVVVGRPSILCDQKAGGRHLFGSLMSRPETTRHPPPTHVARPHVHACRQPTRRANFVAHEGNMTSGIHSSGSRTWSHLNNATHAYDPRTACIKKGTQFKQSTWRPSVPRFRRPMEPAHFLRPKSLTQTPPTQPTTQQQNNDPEAITSTQSPPRN